jgi:GntR family transcriptional regulator/MocR family aminotransferase
MARFQEKLGFYSCTVPSFEQYTLARFLQEGHFDKHINRSRRFYKARRDQVLALIGGRGTILEENAGLHFILKLDTRLSDQLLEEKCRSAGLSLRALSSYYHRKNTMPDTHSLVVSYAGLSDDDLDKLQTLLDSLK